MRFWWLAVLGWLTAFVVWFQELLILVFARLETDYADWKISFYLLLWITIVFSFFHAAFKPPASIPRQFACSKENAEKVAKELKLEEIRYCDQCKLLKPDRAHHCKVCNRCVLRMDHHCPILQICVHHGNHKFYLLFLIWPGLLGIYGMWQIFPSVHRAVLYCWSTGNDVAYTNQFVISAFINAVTTFSAVGYLLRSQLPNLFYNRTIIEHSKISSADEEDHFENAATHITNISTVMGSSWSWLLPVDSIPGDGIRYD